MLINANSRCANRTFRQVNLYQNNLYGVHLHDCVFIAGDMDEVNLESVIITQCYPIWYNVEYSRNVVLRPCDFLL